jgi:hypothetical protein
MTEEECVSKILESVMRDLDGYSLEELASIETTIAILVKRAKGYGMSYYAINVALGQDND